MSERAQRSEIHEATEDSTASPSNVEQSPGATSQRKPVNARGPVGSEFERGAADRDLQRGDQRGDRGRDASQGLGGASDGSSGGGASAGIPGGGTDMRSNGAFSGGDVEADREKLFPDPPASAPPGRQDASDELRIRNDDDESSFGGPLRINAKGELDTGSSDRK